MKIVHVIEPFAAGVAVFVKYLTETMPDDQHIVIHGERKQVIAAEEVKRMFNQANVRFIRWEHAQRSVNPYKDYLALIELRRTLKDLRKNEGIDSVHLHSAKSGLLGRIACRMLRIKNVFYTPNGAPFLSGDTKASRYLYRLLEKFGNLFGGKVVCCSASELNTYLQAGIKATFINNGIRVEDKLPEAPVIKNKKFKIITTGRIIKQKNPSLFNNIAEYFSEFDQFEFIWAGDGPDRDLLTARNITVTGWKTDLEIRHLVGYSSMYVSTALYEGLSFGVLEALMLNKPVLLSHCVGNMDVVKSGINGDLFKTPTEAMMKIIQYYNNGDMLRVMGDYSKSICETEFNVSNNFSGYRQLYANTSEIIPGHKWSFA